MLLIKITKYDIMKLELLLFFYNKQIIAKVLI